MSLTIDRPFQFATADHGRRTLTSRHTQPPVPPVPPVEPPGRIPRITRLMALAIKLDGYLRDGVVTDYAQLARLGHVTRARITQIMNLNLLAPDIQEAILNLPRTLKGRDPIRERHVRAITSIADWSAQRRAWDHVHRQTGI